MKYPHTHTKGKGAFSLIELLIVVAIIAMLSAAIIFTITSETEGVEHKLIQSDLKGIVSAANICRV